MRKERRDVAAAQNIGVAHVHVRGCAAAHTGCCFQPRMQAPEQVSLVTRAQAHTSAECGSQPLPLLAGEAALVAAAAAAAALSINMNIALHNSFERVTILAFLITMMSQAGHGCGAADQCMCRCLETGQVHNTTDHLMICLVGSCYNLGQARTLSAW